MLSTLKGLLTTLRTSMRKPVTAQYPKQHLPLMERQWGFPALTWDRDVGEPYCVACMVCIRMCPTLCMSATMKDNPLHAEGVSTRRKIVDDFAINLGRCILCGICVEVCNFDAIEMSHEHEISHFERDGRRTELPMLLEMGKKYQRESNWLPPASKKPAVAAAKPAAAVTAGAGGADVADAATIATADATKPATDTDGAATAAATATDGDVAAPEGDAAQGAA